MNVNNVNLMISAVKKSQYPSNGLPEIAFIGRSNVGKSSFINKLINRKSMARVSSVPGKTITINFYNVENKLIFVDLPGYGYAKRSKEEIARWGNMIEEYLLSRRSLKMAVLLVDIRHKPSNDDIMMLDCLLDNEINTLVVATKKDKLKKSQLEPSLNLITETLELPEHPIAFSSETGEGKDEVWEILESIL